MAQITYADKVAINENPNVADINKVKANDMNEIKSVVNLNDNNVGDINNLKTTTNTSVVGAINEICDGFTYSTTEQVTNIKYNNKPVYRKMIIDTVPTTGTDGTAAQKQINIGGNCDKIFIKLFQIETSTDVIPSYLYETNAGYKIKTFISNKKITIYNYAKAFNEAEFLAIVEYTKTTD